MRTGKILRRIKEVKISSNIIIALILLGVILTLSGGIYVIVHTPPSAIILASGRVLYIVPLRYSGALGIRQTVSESMVVAFFMILGLVGIASLFKSIEYLYDYRTSRLLIVLGLILLLASFAGLNWIFWFKRYGL